MPDTSWAIIGGGMLGGTFAKRLAESGKSVTLFESAPALGGLTSQITYKNISWDHFYHVIENTDSELLALLAELGLASHTQWKNTKTNYFDGTHLYPLNNVLDYLRLPALGMLDKIRIGLTILRGASIKNARHLEEIRQEDWLKAWSGERAFNVLWSPLLRGKLGDNYKNVSASFIWSVIHRFYGARSGVTKTETFGYVSGGYARILQGLGEDLKKLNVKIRTSSQIDDIRTEGGQCSVHIADKRYSFDRVLVTTPSPVAAKLCSTLDDAQQRQHSQLAYQGVVCVSALLSRPLGDAYLTYITDTSIPFTTIIEMSSLVDRKHYDNHHLVYLPKYVASDDPLFEQRDEDITALFFTGVRKMFPDFDNTNVITSHVSKARFVMALPVLGYSLSLPPITTSQPNVYICNSAHIVNASLSVNESVALANRVSHDLLVNS